jgi:hypothetical protein
MLAAKQENQMGQAKRESGRWEDLMDDVAAIGVRTGALRYDDDLDEFVRTEDSQAERHTYASATNRQKRGLLNGSLQEVREAIKETLDDAG